MTRSRVSHENFRRVIPMVSPGFEVHKWRRQSAAPGPSAINVVRRAGKANSSSNFPAGETNEDALVSVLCMRSEIGVPLS